MARVSGQTSHDTQDGGNEADVWLVWCFEHCCKAEHGDVRRDLIDLAATFGCKCVHHKKVMGFKSWLEGRKGRLLLIADWREAKPVIEELSKRRESQDFRMCVVAPSERVRRRASLWKESQNSEILLLGAFSRQRVEEFIKQNLKAFQPRAAHTGRGEENSHVPALTRPKPMEIFYHWSLRDLLTAVQDPQQAAGLERILKQAMWQVYED